MVQLLYATLFSADLAHWEMLCAKAGVCVKGAEL